ncbi:ABC transporter ATP-binding protein [Clostridium beijerinckii]|jgi:ATP-binding cassette subfamily B protein|uniref:ABC transporter ATP-binding protein n=2 Tax=Clostridium beijerinckii TaxID=1520 RepID=A0AAE2RRK4_CLOBE|nr:ABC transporter ATP-binding protein [Clostridium beijerinckii]ABR34944.1 ABC transporter related [Clostridium beijerinckii NCIMB 8052]AIU01681.1 ABC transporter related protein [Clostridium beijerinckii ATCC 35702]MBC2458480.1 ABC transporter ATP-binding protein [Clostridium beijerinckii]MBC2473408.1 ABC transporter ATP-binding protein [Clostridium beijerinckii]MBF7810420.1 ABC transporter ATP-binding protein [Clostridium beijerinckii]
MNDILHESSKIQIVKRLLTYVKPYKLKVTLVILLLLIVMACNSVTPYLMKISIDTFVADKNVKALFLLGCGLILMNVFSMILSGIRTIAMSKITNQILVDIRHSLYTHIQTLSFNFFDNRPVGKIISRVVGDVNALQNLLNNSIVNLIPNVFTIILVICLMLILNPMLAGICLITMPLLLFAMFYIQIKADNKWKVFREHRSSLIGYTHESLSGMKVIQGFSRKYYAKDKFDSHIGNHAKGFMTAVFTQDFFWPFLTSFRGLSMVILLGSGYLLSKQGNLSLGTLMAFFMYIEMLWRPIINLSSFYNAFVTSMSAGERIFDILDTKSDIVDEASIKDLPQIKGDIEFDHVTFSYTNADIPALKNTSFKLKAGEKIALVGETGAGKTTITNLISRFYDPTFGSVKIDGVDIKDVTVESLRSQMGIMLQDSFLFSTSIKENIRYGKLNATDEEVIQAAKAVNAHEFIERLEKGYDTDVNERGSRLSLGQRQLIAFARALIADPRILILDEATANIDTETELLVQEGIKKLMEGRTSIVIAHRLSTIRDCDKIFVLSKGRIVESGTHDELLKNHGYYYKLYSAQYSFLKQDA